MCEHCGMEQLRSFLAQHKMRPSELAEVVGTSRGYIHDILNRRRRPGLEVATRIERATGGEVPASTWVEDADPPTSRGRE